MKDKGASWKQKVDPAFSTFIIMLDKLLDSVDMPDEATIEEFMDKAVTEGSFSFKDFYGPSDPKSLPDLAGIFDMERILRVTSELEASKSRNDHTAFYKTLSDLFNDFDIESREFYLKAFWPLSSEENIKKFGSMSEKDKTEFLRGLSTNITMLLYHSSMKDMDVSVLHREKRNILKRFTMKDVLQFSFEILDKISTMINKKSLRVLYQEARNGEEEALVLLLKMDKTLFDHEWFRSLILRAMMEGDEDFFQRIGQAFGSEPPFGKLKRGRLKYILIHFWSLGLFRLTIPELVKLLEDSGFEVHVDIESFRKFLDREIKPLFNTA